jgi:hypothetical protein
MRSDFLPWGKEDEFLQVREVADRIGKEASSYNTGS